MSKNAVSDFLDSVDDDFGSSESNIDETFENPQEVKEETKEETKTEKAVPFHKDPKVQRFIDRQVAKALEAKGSVPETQSAKTDEDDYYERLIGNDTPEKVAMIREAKARDERLLKQAEERAWGRLSEEQQKKVVAEQKAEEELDSSLEDIETTFDIDITSNDPVAKKLRVDFLKFAERLAPKDRSGNIIDYPDMVAAFETFQERKTPNNNRAKDLASRSISRSAEVSSKPQERITFDTANEYIDRLLK